MFSRKLNIRLVLSVVISCVNLNKMNVHVKNLKIKRQPVHWFGLTELNKTMGKCVAGIHVYTGSEIRLINSTTLAQLHALHELYEM